jgi:hypothetical protein
MARGRNRANVGMRGLTASVLVLISACATAPRGESFSALVSEQQAQAQASQLEQRAARFRWDQQMRLEGVLTRLLLGLPGRPPAVEVAACDAVNAYVSDGRIKVCLGMLRFVQSDDELAVVLGHELGHLPTAAEYGLLGGGQIDAERQADIRGLFYAHRAGYDIKSGARVFERMAVELSSGLWEADSHPTHAERIVLAERIALLFDARGAESDPEVTLKRLYRLTDSFDDLP